MNENDWKRWNHRPPVRLAHPRRIAVFISRSQTPPNRLRTAIPRRVWRRGDVSRRPRVQVSCRFYVKELAVQWAHIEREHIEKGGNGWSRLRRYSWLAGTVR